MNILMVDDDIDSRNSLTRFLTHLGHHVIECGDGAEALTLLKNGTYHLVLSDIKMPGMDGYELLRRIKRSRRYRDIVVVLITGYGGVRGAVNAIKEGAYDYLLKPIQVNELAALIERIAEYVALKQENRILREDFDMYLKEATKEVKQELEDIKKAYAREIGTAEVGIFSPKLRKVFKTAQKLHHNPDVPVLIEGETGTGKELVARSIHYGKLDITTPFVGLNCAAISPNLFESELFGYEAGAFTGGNPKGQKGKLELADGGSIFLDEITEMPVDYQAKLLRVIQEKEYYRVGGLKKCKVNVRFICSTNKNVDKELADGSLRDDLYYRLNVGYIRIPPLRERREEIIPLTKMFLDELAERKKTSFMKINPKAANILEDYMWPGNVRELRSIVERISLLWDDDEIKPEHLLFLTKDSNILSQQKKAHDVKLQLLNNVSLPAQGLNLDELIMEIVGKAVNLHRGNKTNTAKYLGITRSVLYTYIQNLEK